MSRNLDNDLPESRRERARRRRKAFRSVNIAWAYGFMSDEDHCRARRRLKMNYQS